MADNVSASLSGAGRLRAALAQRLVAPSENAEHLRAWRHSLLNGLCCMSCLLGLLLGLPSIWYSAKYGLWGLVGADIAALCVLAGLHRRRDIGYRYRAGIFLAVVYSTALSLLFAVGVMTQIYLLAVPVLCTLLLGSRSAILAVLASTATLFLAGYFGNIPQNTLVASATPLLHWTILSTNFLLVAAILVISCAYLLYGLEGALARQRAVQAKLEAQISMLQAREVALRESVAAQKAAEESNEQKSEFLAMISHEVRTPLGGVIGMLRLAKKDATLAPATRNKLRISLNNAEVLLQIINDILDFSRLEAGKMPLECIDFDLPALLRDVGALLGDRAETKGISLLVEVDPALGQWWRGDPTRLRQVAMNLVGNGIKFTEWGEVKLAARVAPEGIELTVSDSGIGIPPEAMDRLFRMFEQASAATSRKYGGTGLGLAICKNIVNAMRGRIDVSSQPGLGTEFTVTLPLQPGQPVPDRQAEARQPHARALRVLCAEDGATNQIILRELLSGMGHTVQVAVDGKAALEALAMNDYDLVVMDSRMPRMDGITALRQLRAGAAGQRAAALPVLALTANATPEERQRFLAAGANGFLSKPIDESNLHGEIGRLVDALAAGAPSLAALDAMFQAAPLTPSPAMRSIFRAEAPRQVAALRQALAARDAQAVSMHAHSLLGSAGYFAAEALCELCGRIERLANAGELDGIAPHAAALEQELAGVLARVR